MTATTGAMAAITGVTTTAGGRSAPTSHVPSVSVRRCGLSGRRCVRRTVICGDIIVGIEMRKQRAGSDKSLLEQGWERELREVQGSLNRFLQVHFRLEIESLQEYLHRVKDLLVELTTRQTSALSSIFSKFSNILQPFTSYSYDLSLDALKLETATLRDANRQLTRRLARSRAQLDDYRLKSNRAMDFIYLLRTNAVDVDGIMRAGVMQTRAVEEWEEEGEVRRAAEVVGELGLGVGAGLGVESSLSSQYVSVKSKR